MVRHVFNREGEPPGEPRPGRLSGSFALPRKAVRDTNGKPSRGQGCTDHRRGGGIGLATAELFAREGAALVLADSQAELLGRETQRLAAGGGRVRDLAIDVTRSADVRNAVALARDEFGRLDILFANAGVGFDGAIVKTTDEDWDRVMGVNAKGVFISCREAVRQMLAQEPPGGSIVITGSISSLAGIPGQAPTPPAKAQCFSSRASLLSSTRPRASG